MELTDVLIKKGFVLENAAENDLGDFIYVERMSHNQYVTEHIDFFGEWNENILINAFNKKLRLSYFQKIVLDGEIVGFLGYDKKNHIIDDVFIRLLDKVQNNGIGTLFLSNMIVLSEKFSMPIIIVVIKTNPAQNLYKKMGFEFYKEEDVFYYFIYNSRYY